MNKNLILKSDSYKTCHFKLLKPGTTHMQYHFLSRGGLFPKVRLFGLQYLLKEYLVGRLVFRQEIDKAEKRCKQYGIEFNKVGWEYIMNKHGGYLPIRITALPEGYVYNVRQPLFTVENTDPNCAWLPGYMETLLERVWAPTTVCTGSWYAKQEILRFLNKTADDPQAEIMFKLHDFGARGVSSGESAGILGLAHLVNFMGSDTLEAADFAEEYYDCTDAAVSINASEHSNVGTWGPTGEVDFYRNAFQQYLKPGTLLALVADTYNLWNTVDNIVGGVLRDKIIKSGAIHVVRPDSADPVKTPVEVVERLDAKFGHTINTKGYKVLNHVRVIQGDGVVLNTTEDSTITQILTLLEKKGYSASNIAFGSGGGLLQKWDRDTQKMAYKGNWARINGIDVDVYKDPITDPGKSSHRGYIDLTKVGGRVVFENGRLLVNEDLYTIRNRA